MITTDLVPVPVLLPGLGISASLTLVRSSSILRLIRWRWAGEDAGAATLVPPVSYTLIFNVFEIFDF